MTAPGALQTGEREEQLARVPFFDGLSYEALGMLARVAHEEKHAAGALLFQHGDPGDKVYVVVDGQVRISRDLPGLGEEALAVLGGGEVFGEMALFDDGPRSADARAHTNCTLLAIARDAFEDLLFLHKELAYEVLWSCVRLLTSRLRETNEKVALVSASQRF